MGLKCTILGHSYDPAGVEREREQRGSEVVTVVRELEECSDCGTRRVVSENTEVTAVVDADEVGVETDDAAPEGTDQEQGQGQGPSGIAGAVERSGAMDDDAADEPAGGADVEPRPDADVDTGEDTAHPAADDPTAEEFDDIDPDDPEADDAEILTDDDEDEREPGQWPEEADAGPSPPDEDADEPDATGDLTDELDEDVEEESLSGITVPEGRIVCPECDFEVEAQSGYREGDPCPECGAWLEAERTD